MGHQPKKWIIFAHISMALIFFSLYGCSREQSPPAPPQTSTSPTSDIAASTPLKHIVIGTGNGLGTPASRSVVAIHGLGDTPQNLSLLFSEAPFAARILLPQAPSPWGHGFTWFPVAIPVRQTPPNKLKKDVSRATQAICSFLRSQKFKKKPIVTGFSQGGMLTFAAAITCPKFIHAALPISGFLPLPVGKRHSGIPPIIAFHGTDDAIIEIDRARDSIDKLQKEGFHAVLHEFKGVGHAVPLQMHTQLMKTIEEYL